MTTFIKIAFRNILRNKKRSGITISAVGFGLGALIFIWSFVEGAHKQMIENYTSYITAQIQIQYSGYQKSQKLETYIQDPGVIRSHLNHPNIKAFAPRIRGEALLGSSSSSVGALIMGVIPELETQVSTLHKRLTKGVYLKTEDHDKIILGSALARNLDVLVGDKIVIMGQALDGSMAGGAYDLIGIIDTGAEEIDKGLAIITHTAAEELFVMEGKTTQIALKLNDVDQTDETVSDLASKLDGKNLEILPWREVSPILQQWLEYDNTFVWIIVFIVMVVVAIGILNTVLMGVLERTREFGILQAIGTKSSQIVLMVAWESIFLGIIGTLAGFLLGLGLTLAFAKQGIDLSLFTGALNSFYMDPIIHPAIYWPRILISLGLVLGTSFLVSIYPAWMASKLEPVVAIRSQ